LLNLATAEYASDAARASLCTLQPETPAKAKEAPAKWSLARERFPPSEPKKQWWSTVLGRLSPEAPIVLTLLATGYKDLAEQLLQCGICFCQEQLVNRVWCDKLKKYVTEGWRVHTGKYSVGQAFNHIHSEIKMNAKFNQEKGQPLTQLEKEALEDSETLMLRMARLVQEQYSSVLDEQQEAVLKTMNYDEICAKLEGLSVADVMMVPEDDVYGIYGSVKMDLLRKALTAHSSTGGQGKAPAQKVHQPAFGQYDHDNTKDCRSAAESSRAVAGRGKGVSKGGTSSRSSSASSASTGSWNVVGSSRSDTGSELEYRKPNTRDPRAGRQ
jgi:hypothetical protein